MNLKKLLINIVIFFNITQKLIKIKEIPEEDNEDDVSSKIRKAESDNEKASSNFSKSRGISKIVDPNERVQILMKKHEIAEQKITEKKKINEQEVKTIFLLHIKVLKEIQRMYIRTKNKLF